MAATIPGMLIAGYFIQKFYLLTSRQLRLLDLEAKSPLYTLFSETTDGISAIRGFGWQAKFNQMGIAKLDDSQKPFYLLFCIQRWLMLVIDLTAGSMGVVVIALALCIPGSSSGGFLGVALTSILTFNGNLGSLISNWTNAETSIGSVTRTRSFELDTPKESQEGCKEPKESWPTGDVHVSGISVVFE